jgi:hypothetical protein
MPLAGHSAQLVGPRLFAEVKRSHSALANYQSAHERVLVLDNLLITLVGAAGLEPAAPCSQSALKRALPEARIADTVLGVAKEPPSVCCRNFRSEFRHGPRGTSCRDFVPAGRHRRSAVEIAKTVSAVTTWRWAIRHSCFRWPGNQESRASRLLYPQAHSLLSINIA